MKKNESNNLTENRQFSFETYGVKIGVSANTEAFLEEIIERIGHLLPNGLAIIDNQEAEHYFRFDLQKNGVCWLKICLNDRAEIFAGELNDWSKDDILDYFDNQLHLAIGELAVSRVFLHAGVVGWKGKAIILPARMQQGKTTLIVELIKCGAQYYSDEYAVLDDIGFVHPFAKRLSIRGIIDEHTQTDISPETFGAEIGVKPIPVGLILLTEYETDAVWKPEKLGFGDAIMAMVPHTIPMRTNPAFSFKVLNTIAGRALVARSKRGEAEDFASLILSLAEKEKI